ncbi:MAG: glycosyltransferase [Bacteroidetes bacterium]|nr:glycosyltransferase [Bacteroidota bacterium]
MVYNNVLYIKQALDGILMQILNGSYEIVIGDDFSDDGTFEIIKQYELKYPHLIKVLERNIGDEYYQRRVKGNHLINFIDILNNCKGKYIALLDGDDYWIDPYKLQKQVDLLENNKRYSIVAHDVGLLYDGVEEVYPFQTIFDKQEFGFIDEFNHHFISTKCSFRRSELYGLPPAFENNLLEIYHWNYSY